MLKPCKDCGTTVEYKPRRTTLCNPCKATRHREYCKRTNYHRSRYEKVAPAERERHLVRKYGVTQADYERMLAEQSGCCAICKKSQSRSLDVDHCHKTGRVRGLLCTNCNRLVGHAGDSPEILRAAADYLVPQVAAEFIGAVMEE